MEISLEDGKYTYRFRDGVQTVHRYGEPWRDLTGDKFVYLLAAKIEQLEDENARLREELAAWKEGHTKEKLSAIEWAGKCQELQEQLATLKAELDKAKQPIERAFAAHPNLDLDIEFAMQKENGK